MNNQKGFTLIEVIVSIAIVSILLMIGGSMIVSSFETVYTTTDLDMDKRTLDSIADVVRSDIEYSYEVKLAQQDNQPNIEGEEGWHWLYVDNGYLYVDDRLLFPESFYNNKTIMIYANAYVKSSARVDFTYEIRNRKDELVYGTRDSVIFLNVIEPETKLGIYDSSNEIALTKDGSRLYYRNQRDYVVIPRPPIDPVTPDDSEEKYTVVIDKEITEDAQLFEGKTGDYQVGTVVLFEGEYWQKISDDGNNSNDTPSSDSGWRKLAARYDKNSEYIINDVVIDKCQDGENDCYYRALINVTNGSNGNQLYCPYGIYDRDGQLCRINKGNGKGTQVWELLGSVDDPSARAQAAMSNTGLIINGYADTLVYKYWPSDCSSEDVNVCPGVIDYVENSTYQAEDIVKYSFGGKTYLYVSRVANNTKQPGNKNSGWAKISLYYDENSTYMEGDVVAMVAIVAGREQLVYAKYRSGRFMTYDGTQWHDVIFPS